MENDKEKVKEILDSGFLQEYNIDPEWTTEGEVDIKNLIQQLEEMDLTTEAGGEEEVDEELEELMKLLEEMETDAGEEAADDSSNTIVRFDLDGNETTPESGAETDGVGNDFVGTELDIIIREVGDDVPEVDFEPPSYEPRMAQIPESMVIFEEPKEIYIPSFDPDPIPDPIPDPEDPPDDPEDPPDDPEDPEDPPEELDHAISNVTYLMSCDDDVAWEYRLKVDYIGDNPEIKDPNQPNDLIAQIEQETGHEVVGWVIKAGQDFIDQDGNELDDFNFKKPDAEGEFNVATGVLDVDEVGEIEGCDSCEGCECIDVDFPLDDFLPPPEVV